MAEILTRPLDDAFVYFRIEQHGRLVLPGRWTAASRAATNPISSTIAVAVCHMTAVTWETALEIIIILLSKLRCELSNVSFADGSVHHTIYRTECMFVHNGDAYGGAFYAVSTDFDAITRSVAVLVLILISDDIPLFFYCAGELIDCCSRQKTSTVGWGRGPGRVHGCTPRQARGGHWAILLRHRRCRQPIGARRRPTGELSGC